jgi:hypothetical protein
MILKLSDYEHCLPNLQRSLELRADKKKVAVEFSACSGIPIIVVYKMILDLGITDERISTRLVEMCEESGVKLI